MWTGPHPAHGGPRHSCNEQWLHDKKIGYPTIVESESQLQVGPESQILKTNTDIDLCGDR